jgi:hypothetical protein
VLSNTPMRFVASLGVAVIVGLVGFVACAPPEDPQVSGKVENQKTPDPSFDAGGAAPAQPVACSAANYAQGDDAACTVTWAADIYPLIKGAWNCANGAGCHGTGGVAPVIDTTDAKTAFAALAMYTSAKVTRPYINPCSKVEAESAFTASLTAGGNGAGTKMPIGTPATAADIAKVKTWLECGAPAPQ